MNSIPLTNAEQLWCFYEHLEELGIDIEPYLEKNLIPKSARQEGRAKLTTIQVYDFLQDVVTTHGLHQLGWDVGCRFGADALQGFTLDAFAHGRSEALFQLTSVVSSHATNARFFVLRDKNQFELCNIASVPARTEAHLQTEYYILAIYIDFVRRVFNRADYSPTRIRFRSADLGHEPVELRDIATDYNQPYLSVDIPPAWYKRPKVKMVVGGKQPNIPLSNTLKTLLKPHLPQRMLTIDQLSSITGIPVRNLQRQLEREETHYRELILNLRMGAAKDLLRQTTLSVKEIAKKVGYSQTTHFTRAFKSKQDQTPREFRSRYRQSMP
jgi:AraC-like DNA-binding protein